MRAMIVIGCLAVVAGCATVSPLTNPVTVIPFQAGTVVFVQSLEQIQYTCLSVQRTSDKQYPAACYEGTTRTLYCVYGDAERCWHEMLHHLGFTHPVGGGQWAPPRRDK